MSNIERERREREPIWQINNYTNSLWKFEVFVGSKLQPSSPKK